MFHVIYKILKKKKIFDEPECAQRVGYDSEVFALLPHIQPTNNNENTRQSICR
jgi:hypothetical protein